MNDNDIDKTIVIVIPVILAMLVMLVIPAMLILIVGDTARFPTPNLPAEPYYVSLIQVPGNSLWTWEFQPLALRFCLSQTLTASKSRSAPKPFQQQRGEVLLRGVGAPRYLLILGESSACQVPICAVAA